MTVSGIPWRDKIDLRCDITLAAVVDVSFATSIYRENNNPPLKDSSPSSVQTNLWLSFAKDALAVVMASMAQHAVPFVCSIWDIL